MTDPVGDFIIRIKNAVMARHEVVRVNHSKLNLALAEILKQENYISEAEVDSSAQFPELVLTLRYVGRQPAVTDVRRLSKPGRRLYAPSKTIPRALGGYGITILSTNKGVMTDKQARKLNVGGELLCQIW